LSTGIKINIDTHERSTSARCFFCFGEGRRKRMKQIFTKEWWAAAGVRALKTVCQTAIASIGTAVVMSDVNWIAVASASVLAGILSLLTSLAGLPEVEDKTS
jgi:hypothetical protein